MKTRPFLCVVCILVFAWGCKKENRILHELSGTWEIQKSEISTYVNGEVDSVAVLENLGNLELEDTKDVSHDFKYCYFNLAQGYWPLGFSLLDLTNARQLGFCRWYGDLRARDRITFWAQGGFAAADEIFVIYTRVKNAHGPGRKEQWMFVNVDANGAILQKEVLYVKLVDASGRIN